MGMTTSGISSVPSAPLDGEPAWVADAVAGLDSTRQDGAKQKPKTLRDDSGSQPGLQRISASAAARQRDREFTIRTKLDIFRILSELSKFDVFRLDQMDEVYDRITRKPHDSK